MWVASARRKEKVSESTKDFSKHMSSKIPYGPPELKDDSNCKEALTELGLVTK
jgi:hypothetical protein